MKLAKALILVGAFQLICVVDFYCQIVSTNSASPPGVSSITSPYEIIGGDFIADMMRRQLAIEDFAKVPKPYKERYRQFLKTKNSGIVKLYPSELANILDANENNKRIPRACAFFSFSSKQHKRYLADIRFAKGLLWMGLSPGAFGVARPIGETPLENVTLDSAEIAKMLKSPLAKTSAVAEPESLGMASISPVPGTTYALRSVHERAHELLIAFQVLETTEDGGIIMIWKRLYKGKAPKNEKPG